MKNGSPPSLRILLISIVCMVTAFSAPWHMAVAQSGPNQAAPQPAAWNLADTNQIIVKYSANANMKGGESVAGIRRMQALSAAAGVDLTYVRSMSGGAHVMRLPARMPEERVLVIARQLASLPDVEYAEADRVMFPSLAPNDTQYGAQWHFTDVFGIRAPAGWDVTTGSSSIRIAVLDTGITEHSDLNGRWVGGYDFVSNVPTANDGNGRDSDPHDPGDWVSSGETGSGPFAGCPAGNSSWHGTHVAGIIGAKGNNGSGVTGINWVSPIVPVRVLGKCGGYVSDIADGMRWAAGLSVSGVPANPHPARVLNLSLGGPGVCSTTYQNAIDAVNSAGAIVVVAAGNNGSNLNTNTYQPANCNGVITVAATDRDGDKAIYSNYGTVVKISAPGGETYTSSPSPSPQNGILSTLNTGITTPGSETYGYKQGTSMAAPVISGVVSLMVSLDPTLSSAEIIQLLQNTASSFPAGSGCSPTKCGSGIVNAGAALAALPAPPTATRTSIPPTATKTPLPPTATNTPVPPTATNTALPPTATNTPKPPTATNTAPPVTATHTPKPPTATRTQLPPTATSTPKPPTATNTPPPPTATRTSLPPTATATPLIDPTLLDKAVYLPMIYHP